MQDPPELIKEFIAKWEEGFRVVIAVKQNSDESPLFFAVRKSLLRASSRGWLEIDLNKNATGFGLYDRRFIDILKEIDDPYPYFRGWSPKSVSRSARKSSTCSRCANAA